MADMCDILQWAMSEKCHAAEHPHRGLSPISWINLQYDNPNLGYSEGKYLHENVEVSKTTRDSWNGCVSLLTEKKKWKKENML